MTYEVQQKMEQKNKQQRKILCSMQSNQELNDKWADKQVNISLGQIKYLLKCFRALGIKDDSSTLIFADEHYNFFRVVGEQHQAFVFLTEDPDMKPTNTKTKKNSIRLSLSSNAVDCKRINGVLVFPDVRVPSDEAARVIKGFEDEIANLEKAKQDFINEEFMAWDFLTYEQAKELVSDRQKEWEKNNPQLSDKFSSYNERKERIANAILEGR